MKVSPINYNQYNSKNPSFNAVNQKHLERVIKKCNQWKPHIPPLGHELSLIEIEASYRLISYQDAIDTLEAIKPYAQDAIECIDDSIEKLKRVIAKQSNQ